MKILRYLLIFIPISFIGEFIQLPQTYMFFLSALAIIPLAGIMGESTEVISYYAGNRIGGFLNATFGNATELIIAFFAMKEGLSEVVKASIAGSVIGNILLVLGLSMIAGGLKHKTQYFNQKVLDVTSSMLLFAVIGLSIPAIFTHAFSQKELTSQYEGLSVIVAIVMLCIYVLSLLFSFFTHKDLYISEQEKEEEKPKQSLKIAIILLIIATVCIGIESEIFVGTVEPMTKTFGLSEFFVGIILVPIIGNAAEHSTAVMMALKNKMNISIEIALGSSLQIILFVTPVLILLSLIFSPMSIVFNTFELAALIFSVLIANKLSSDGESNWLEGAQLVAVYIIIAAGFFILK